MSKATGDNTPDRATSLLDRLLAYPVEVRLPTTIPAAAYDTGLDSMVSAVADHEGVVAVYGDSDTPTAPSISDVDVTIVVEDDLASVDHLASTIRPILEHHDGVFVHGPVIVPESVFRYLPLMANMSSDLSHLRGEVISPLSPTPRAGTLEFLDRFAFEPYTYLERQVIPTVDTTAHPMISALARVVAPPIVAATGRPMPIRRRLSIDLRTALSKAKKIECDHALFQRIAGRRLPSVEDALEDVRELRESVVDEPPSTRAVVETIVNAMRAGHDIQAAFLEHQSVYRPESHTYLLDRWCPAIATPTWHALAIEDHLETFDRAGLPGHILPPTVATHLATFPDADALFLDSPPQPRFTDGHAATLVERRNDALRAYRRFLDRTDPDPRTFSLVTAAFLREHATAQPDSRSPRVATLKAYVRRARNRSVAKSWRELAGSIELDRAETATSDRERIRI